MNYRVRRFSCSGEMSWLQFEGHQLEKEGGPRTEL